MILSKYKTPLIIAGILLAFYIVSFFSYTANQTLHAIVDIFAGGRSSVKMSFYIGFTTLLCILAMFSGKSLFKKFNIKNSRLLTLIIINLLYNLSLLFLFFSKFKFKLDSFVITFHNNEISSTTLLHNHVGKGFNAILLSPFGLAKSENVDTGLAYVGLIHPFWFWIGGFLFLLLAIAIIVKFVEIYREKVVLNSFWEPVFIVSYSIASFSILKNCLDGGLLNRETPIALSGLLLIIYAEKIRENKKLLWTAVLPMAIFLIEPIIDIELFYSYIGLILIFTAILGTLIYWLYQEKPNRLGVLLIILSITILYGPMADVYDSYNNSKQLIPQEGAVAGLYNPPSSLEESKNWEKIEQINNLTLYKYIPSQPITINSLIVDNRLLSNLGPITIPWMNCLPASPNKTITFDVSSFQKANGTTSIHKLANITKMEGGTFDAKTKLYHYKITTSINPCAPRILNIVGDMMEERGLKDFFIFNISDINDAV